VIPRDIVKADQTTAVPAQTDSQQEAQSDSQQETPADPQDEASSSPAEESQDTQAEPATAAEAGGEAPREALTEPVITDTSYDDGQIYIEISYMRTLDTDVYIADVIINNPAFLKTALAEGAFGRNLTDTTSNIAEQNGAIFAVNGDYYGFRDTGYVMRNGYLYRSVPGKDPEQEDLVLYEDGTVRILRESEYTAEEIRDSGAVDVFSFGPGLVIDGEVSVSSGDEVERAQVTNPRTAFGVISPLHYLFVVSDGRTDESTGLSLLELADLMKEMGCVTAYNLDGGGSSTMWFNGKVLNRPTTLGDTIAERNVSDIVYIGK
jgi:exopolysaccharide biosynthesis protein